MNVMMPDRHCEPKAKQPRSHGMRLGCFAALAWFRSEKI